jgi:hypothetical protein
VSDDLLVRIVSVPAPVCLWLLLLTAAAAAADDDDDDAFLQVCE